jgi:signal transduction histidine kinase
VNLADHRRRIRRNGLLLAAILIPTAAVILLVGLVARQQHELAERRASEARRDALEQLRRELTARLQALRLEEVNRLIGESGTRIPPDSPIVFVAPMAQDEMILPWRPGASPSVASARRVSSLNDLRPPFLSREHEGELREFQRRDAAGAARAYQQALAAAATPQEQCTARLALGRAYRKAGDLANAETTDRDTLVECRDIGDTDGVPIAVYAAERLATAKRDLGVVTDFAVHAVDARTWPSPSAAYALQSLLQHLPETSGTAAARQSLTRVIHDLEQVATLATDLRTHPEKLQRASRSAPGDLPWMGYGGDPWLVTLVSPTSFAARVVIAVAPRHLVPADVTLLTSPASNAVPLGDGFLDVYVQWPAGRFDGQPAVPAVVYGAVLFSVLGAGLLAAVLLLRDVHRESEMAVVRSNFVASVSHELKTPLTSIRAHAETLLMGRTRGPDAVADYLRTIVGESERLGRLVDSVLEFSRVEQGSKTYHMQSTRLDDVVRAALRTLEYPLAQLGFTLTISSDDTNPTLTGDPAALTRVILNLLGNAMKYSGDARQIELRVGTQDDEAFVEVVDHGIGIPKSEQTRIFERFHRVRSVETEGIAGAGLGLALARHVVEAHRGRIAVVSDVGRGSTFSIHLPIEAQA